jgi:EpsI family protein
MIALARRRALVLLGGSLLAASGARAIRPSRHLAAELGPLALERAIPKSFGPWVLDSQQATTIVNPEVSALLARLYSELLTRTYVHRETGYRVMLTIAYGGDQSDAFGLHYPDVCYPAQGFQILGQQNGELSTPYGNYHLRRLKTQMGSRTEPVTYWVVIGTQSMAYGIGRKWLQLRYAARGVIPDGLLFRLSSIDGNADAAFTQHDAFAQALIADPQVGPRDRLFGLAGMQARR